MESQETKIELTGMAKFMTVGKGVQLVRFKGVDIVKLVGRRVGTCGLPNALFEIVVDRKAKTSVVFKDEKPLFTIVGDGINTSRLEKISVSALHRWFKDNRPSGSKRKKIASAKKEVA